MTLLLLAACTGDNITSEFDTQNNVEADADTDADSDTDTDTDADADADSDTDTDADTDPNELAVVSGEITYSVPTTEDGIGDLYVAIFDKDPVWDSANAVAQGMDLIEDVDFNTDGPAPTYQIADITPRGTAYYILAFFDDNGTATLDNPVPDKGDLISFDLNTFGAPQVLVTAGGEVTHNVDLNAEMPF